MKPFPTLILLLALMLICGACNRAQEPGLGVRAATATSLWAPLAGSVLAPLGGSYDSVNLSGRVHVVASLYPGDPIHISVNLAGVSGVGSSSGLTYRATGARQLTLPAVPEDPINLVFELRVLHPKDPLTPPDPVWPPDPVQPLIIALRFHSNPDTGELSGVEVESVSVPLP